MNEFLLSIINFFYNIVPNYGVAIILFTVFIKLCLTPFDLKSRRSMKRMADINPKIEALKKKYANDKEKLNQKTQELWKAEKINPLSGCLPMLLTFPILIFMFGAMRHIANERLVAQFYQLIHGQPIVMEPFMWIKNIWMPDTFTATIIPDARSLAVVPMDIWTKIINSLGVALPYTDAASFKEFIANQMPAMLSAAPQYAEYAKTVAGMSGINLILFRLSVYVNMNGFFILPILAIVTQYISQKLMPTQTPTAATNADGTPAPNPGKTMMMLMPIMSLWFCTTSSAAFAIYWVTSNVIAAVQQLFFTRYFAWQDRKAAIAQEVGIK